MEERNKGRPFSRQEVAILVVAAILSIIAATLIVAGLVQLAQNDAEATNLIETLETRRENLVDGVVDCIGQYDEGKTATIEAAARKHKAGEVSESFLATLHIIPDTLPELKSDGDYGKMIGELAETELLIAEAQANRPPSVMLALLLMLLIPATIYTSAYVTSKGELPFRLTHHR